LIEAAQEKRKWRGEEATYGKLREEGLE